MKKRSSLPHPKRPNQGNNKPDILFSILAVVALIGLLAAGIVIWDTYKEDIINEQKAQMQIVCASTAENISELIVWCTDELQQLTDEIELLSSADTQIIEQLLVSSLQNSQYFDNIIIRQSDGTTELQINPSTLDQCLKTYTISETVSIHEYLTTDAQMMFVFTQVLADGRTLELDLNLTSYYDSRISHIAIGENGYIIAKNSDGIILMHPTDIQVGEHVIYGREILYPNVDLTSLKELVELQTINPQGVYEYHSYWWTEEDVPSVYKIAAHNHVAIGDDFIIVSAMIDYDDIYSPIVAGFTNITFVFLAILVVILLFSGYIGILLLESKKNLEEIAYLKDLNTVLEKTKKVEEHITHQQRLQIMGTMTSGIVHEFNNMLTPIMGYAELLQTSLPPEGLHYEFANEILASTERAKDSIKQIASLGRKHTDEAFQFIKARRFVSNVSKMIGSMCPTNLQVHIKNEIDSQYGFLGNETQMNQVLLNLFVNAIHATELKENALVLLTCHSISKQALEVKHNCFVSSMWEHYVEIALFDNGIGMDEGTKEQIFNPFFTTKLKDKGTGLGLSLVEQIVNAHKGYLFVESEVNIGSEFFIYLPVTQQAPPSKPLPDAKRPNILFVDNGDTSYAHTEKSLEKLGLDVQFATTIQEAHAVLSSGVQAVFIHQNFTTANGTNRGSRFAMSIHNQYPDVMKVMLVDKIDHEVLDAIDKGFAQQYIEVTTPDGKFVDTIQQLLSL